MKCPACKVDSPVAEYGDPLKCPKCNAYYEKAIWHSGDQLSRSDGERLLTERKSTTAPVPILPHVKKMADMNKGAQPVVVVDLNMSFSSMVVFMIKWAIASIPAMIVLFLIGMVLVAMLAGTFGGLAGLLAK